MTDLRAFIEARLAEDEQVAQEALHPDAVKPGVWMGACAVACSVLAVIERR